MCVKHYCCELCYQKRKGGEGRETLCQNYFRKYYISLLEIHKVHSNFKDSETSQSLKKEKKRAICA